ncbi:YbfB/YjiJ family MFS transporter [Rhizobiales bacterium RZME27]|jgi:MFS family permease|uniref:YbfB/YjiJ family MFS transporter n=1 Tax=Endobacterium cereale TaxID=2663029 RepID=A0A6A8AEM3_9HYPH|nr:YbfB/YjiJ family MFS transporter [Endobacterium cereale]MEB2842969.1 YbfB/YjiJ family MFS transporter [Endobacterium cereale]MQY49775.1 YbfB/YjiJ family MFS transporter [Endobacterium cereale]
MSSSSSPSSSLWIGLAGAAAMAGAMGFGRFVYTPILPGMIAGIPLSAADAGTVAAGNFAGYLLGAIASAYGWAAGRERKVALAGLLASAVLLAAMGLTTSVTAFTVIRFLAGAASALAMLFTTSIVMMHAAGRPTIGMLHFGGVGIGIALSSLLVLGINAMAGDAAHGWQLDWFASAAVVLAIFAFVQILLPKPQGDAKSAAEPPLVWRLPLLLTALSYGLYGFGYVITATFLVAIARMGNTGPMVEFLVWFVAGCTAAVSLFAWNPVVRRIGLGGTYLAAMIVLLAGVVASVELPVTLGTLVGGFMLGATFMAITAFGLQLGRRFAPQSPRRAIAVLTAAFGVGQIVGPLVAGFVAERTGSFTAPSLLAAGVLVAAIALSLPLVRERS